jgi:hypothetical protein
MTKYSRFTFFTKLLILFFVFYFVLVFVEDIMQDYLGTYYRYIKPVYGIMTFVRTFLIIGMIITVGYFGYTIFRYLSSAFYLEHKIPVHEAFFHGYFDVAYAYERFRKYGDSVKVDTKTKSIIITYPNAVYYILIRDIFGRLQADSKSDTWYIVSKKRKQYGNVRYLKRKPVPNPIYENRVYLSKIPKRDGVVFQNYVCLTGLRQNTFNHELINTIYEMEGILQQE